MQDYYIAPEEYETAEKNGIGRSTLEYRIRQAFWDRSEAITKPPQQRRKANEKWIKIANGNGISYKTYMSRISIYGWSEERAATQPLQNRKAIGKKMGEANRVYSKEILKLAEENEIKHTTFRARARKGWSLQYAATKPIITHNEIGENAKAHWDRIFPKTQRKSII